MIALEVERLAGFPGGPAFLESIKLAMTTALQTPVALSSARRELRGGLAPFRLRRVVALIDANLERDLTLRDLARAAGLSVSHFSRAFRSATSLSPHQFILRQRIERAGELIRESDLKVFDVASACGFKTQQHFARIFRRAYGVKPTEYRNIVGSARPNNNHSLTPLPPEG
jgi:AraC family transcriptional regulator